jgi:glycosidase
MLLVGCGREQASVSENKVASSDMTGDLSQVTEDSDAVTGGADELSGVSDTTDTSDTSVNTAMSALDMMKQHEDFPTDQEILMDDKYRTYYEVFLYSYEDSNGDGIGDLVGLSKKLDYIKDMGFNGIWLMPIMPSPTYHKYDVTDYYAIDPVYGTMEEFDAFLAACKERDIRVILDLVMNHTSSRHPWFVEACEYLSGLEGAPNSEDCPYVNYYHFSREKVDGTYYPVPDSDWYYEGHFTADMPDLNLMDENVREEFRQIITFWLDKGVSGFRIDAAKEFESGSPDTNVKILTWLAETVREINPDAYLVAEVWTDLDSYARYYASGIDSVFDYTFGDQSGVIASVLNRKSGSDASTYGQVTASLTELFSRYNPEFIDAPFYTNHDLGRSAGYYAGDGSEEKTKLAQAMNLMMTGNVFLYYGEEIGMKGSGKDENKRAPMYWTADPDATGMCAGPPAMDAVKMKFQPLDEQMEDGNSIYSFVKEAITLRNAYPAIARGITTFAENASDEAICVQIKSYQKQEIALVWNISQESTQVDLQGIHFGSDTKADGAQAHIGGALLTGTQDIVTDGSVITLPPYSMVLLVP